MLAYIYCNGGYICQHIAEIGNHSVRISFRCIIIYCLKVLFNLSADIQPVTCDIFLLERCLCKTVNYCTGLCLQFYFILTVFMNISLKIILINVYANNLRIFCKLVNLGSNLSGTKGNAETEKQVTLCIGDHICITVTIRTANTAKIKRIVIPQHGFCKNACDNRNLPFLGKRD